MLCSGMALPVAVLLTIFLRLAAAQDPKFTSQLKVQPGQTYSVNDSYGSSKTPDGNSIHQLTAVRAAETDCRCGYKFNQGDVTSRIVGGVETGVNEFPMMALILRRVFVRFGGTIIAKRYVLTAAHCVTKQKLENLSVFVGEHNVEIEDESPATQKFAVAEYIIHENYNKSYLVHDHDIALLRLDRDIEFSERVGPACLPFKFTEYKFTGRAFTLLGWGRQQEGQNYYSDTLQKVDVDVISGEACQTVYPQHVMPGLLCTSSPKKDACYGDSGGPGLYTDPATGLQFLCSIISNGRGCARPEYPGIGVNVVPMLDWIRSKTPDVEYCTK